MRHHFARTFVGDGSVPQECAKRIPIAPTHRCFRSVIFHKKLEFTIKSAMKLVVEPLMTVDLSFCSPPHGVCNHLFFPFFFLARREVEGEGKSCRLPLSISHVPVLTKLTDFPFSQRDNLICKKKRSSIPG